MCKSSVQPVRPKVYRWSGFNRNTYYVIGGTRVKFAVFYLQKISVEQLENRLTEKSPCKRRTLLHRRGHREGLFSRDNRNITRSADVLHQTIRQPSPLPSQLYAFIYKANERDGRGRPSVYSANVFKLVVLCCDGRWPTRVLFLSLYVVRDLWVLYSVVVTFFFSRSIYKVFRFYDLLFSPLSYVSQEQTKSISPRSYKRGLVV